MKKLFFIIALLLMTFTLGGCNANKENKELIKWTKNQLIYILERFEGAEDVDLDWEDPGRYFGQGNICVYNEGEGIGLALFEDDIAVMIEISLDDSPRKSLKVWQVNINYIDIANAINMELSYYHYDEGWIGPDDFANETFAINIVDFSKGLSLFTVDDVKYVLTELGYNEVNE